MQFTSNVIGFFSLLGLATAATAQVTNGGFETSPSEFGVPAGWSTDAPSMAGVILDNGNFATSHGAPGPHSGAWDMLLGPNTDDWLTQAISTQASQQYDLTFWLYNATPGANDFSAYWGGTAPIGGQLGSQDNGQQLLSITNDSSFGWTQFTYSVTAATSSTNLTYYGANASTFFGLDDVSLTPFGQNPPSGTPEPGSLALFVGAAITGFGVFVRRKRS